MRLARRWLGALLAIMAAAQVSDPRGFADVLGTYDIPGAGTLPAAMGLVVAELVAGVGLVRGGRLGGLAERLTVGVAFVWAVLAVQAFARHLVLVNCGCFGVHLAQPLWWGVLVQDALFVGAAVLVTRPRIATKADGSGRLVPIRELRCPG